MADKNVISIDKIKVACRDCSLSTLCLPMGLRPEDVDRLDAIVKRSRPMQRGDHIFRSGEAFRHLYVVKTGAVKTYTQTNDGDEQVVGVNIHVEDEGPVKDVFYIDADVESERQVVLEEIAMYEDEPQYLVHDMAISAVYPEQPLGRPVIGGEHDQRVFQTDFGIHMA